MTQTRWLWWSQHVNYPIRILLAISVICLLGSLGPVSAWLAYDRLLVATGDLWRPLTAWVAQLNPSHWLVNQGGLVLLALLLPGRWQRQDTLAFIWVWLLCSLWLALGPYVRYAGLSGLIYGWLIWALWRSPHYHRLIRLTVAMVLVAKVVPENLAGPYGADASGVSAFIRGDIAVQSHLAGLLGGLFAVLVAWSSGFARDRQ
jgi:rhomboid family GlyGly-CTERM serine protease